MGIVSWLRRPGPSSSRPDSSDSAGGRNASRRPASPSDGSELSPAGAVAGSHSTARRLRRGLLPALLTLPLFFGLATEAAAQSSGITVTLSGTSGDVVEGGTKTLRLSLSRRPTSGRIVQVFLTFSGTATQNTDYTLLCSIADLHGINCTRNGNVTIISTFTGGPNTSTGFNLTFSAIADSSAESGGETVSIGLGSVTTTESGGVIVADNLADFRITDAAEPPSSVQSIERRLPSSSPTGADSLTWRVAFKEAVRNVNAADFQVSGTTATITGVSQVAGTNAYDVTASGGNLAGLDATVTLGFASGHDIQKADGSALSANLTPEGTNDYYFVVENTNRYTYDLVASPSANPVNVWVRPTVCDSPAGTRADSCTKRLGRDRVDAAEGGGDAEITVGLSRQLAASQTVTVPLTVSGANVTASDYSITLNPHVPSDVNHGVTLDTSVPNQPVVTFTGHASNYVRLAFLLVSANTDALTEGTETLTLGIASVTSTNIPRGTSLHRRARSGAVRILDRTPQGQNAPVIGIPATAVSNVQVTAVDAANAKVTWDAVDHATSYDVSWEAASTDPQSLTAMAGSEPGVTGTSATIWHDATEAMTLTVTVTPEYVDGNGDTVRLDKLAGTATLAVGPGSTQGSGTGTTGTQAHEAAVADGSVTIDVPASWQGRGRPQVSGGARRLSGWSGLGFGFQGLGSPPSTVTVSWKSRPAGDVKLPLEWQPVAGSDWQSSDGGPVGLFKVSIADPQPEPEPEAEAQQDEARPQAQQAAPAALPVVTVSGGSGVTEGTSASFTVTASPAPSAPLEVKLTVSQSGDVAASGQTGAKTVTVPTSGSVTLAVSTADDAVDEADGSVTATVNAGTGYTVGSAATATVSVADNDAASVPEVTISGGAGVTEGASASFTITASPAPSSPLEVKLTVSQSGAFAASGQTGAKTVTVPTSGSVTLAVSTADDAVDEADGSVTATVDAGTGYTVGSAATATVSVADNDEPVVSIAAGSGVTEGVSASFTVTATPAPHAPLTVKLTVSQSGAFAASGEAGAKTVTVPTSGSVTLEVDTADDAVEETDGSITATVDAGTGYTVAAAPGNAATVKVADNDAAAATGPAFSVGDETINEKDGLMWFRVKLSQAMPWPVSVRFRTRESSPVSAESRKDYFPMDHRLTFDRGKTEERIPVYVINDNHDEGRETFEVVLSDPRDPNGETVIAKGKGTAVGTIVNSDPMPAAWLARFGRTAAEQALDGIAGRIAAPRSAGVQGTVAGQAVNFGGTGSDGSDGAVNDPGSGSGASAAPGSLTGNGLPVQDSFARAFGAGHGGFGSVHDTPGSDRFGFSSGSGAQSSTMTARDALLGSSFTATGETDATGGSLAFWGRAAQSSFDGREGAFSLDGEATTAMLGADYARDRWLVGLALMQTNGEGGYRDTDPRPHAASRAVAQICADAEGMDAETREALCNGAVREGDGKVEASLTAAIPYAALQASERLRLWGAAGYGTGEVTLKPEPGGSYKADITWTMAALGLRGDVIAPPKEGSGPALAVTSDALWARTSSDKTNALAASDSDVTRLRLGLEGSYRMALESGGHLTPKLEVGARHDGGDAETGFGVEVGGGIAWVDPALGLSLDLSGRTLIAHGSDDLKDRGFAASLAWDPDPATKRGPSLSLSQDWGGRAKGGLDALFASDPLADRSGSGDATARWQAEAAYGFPAFGGRFTGSPHMGLGLATGARDYSLGWRLTPAAPSAGSGQANANAPDLSFGVKATRRESDTAQPEHRFGFEAVARW